jgi:phosphohistidine phosphatase
MKLYLLRHGKADWPDWDQPDDERPLTKEGKREMRRIAQFLADVNVAPGVILSSPLPRAYQTAEIAAEALGLEVQEEPALGKGFGAAKARALIKRAQGADLMLVGHEPDFSAVIRALTGGMVKLGKGGIARIDVNEEASLGRLIWLIPPKIARRE